MFPLVVILLCLSMGCSGVLPIGHYTCPDGKSVTYVQAIGANPTGTTTLIVIDRFMHDPKKNETTLIRSDASSVNTGKPWDFLKDFPVPIPLPF